MATTKPRKVPISDVLYCLVHHPEWEGVWQYDEFAKRPLAVNPPCPLDMERTGYTEHDEMAIRTWFEAHGIRVAGRDIYMCVMTAARRCDFHPIKDYFATLPPPREGAIDALTEHAFGISEARSRDFVRKTLIAAVQRILNPACQVDTMLVLYGPQGAGKSSFVRELFGHKHTRSQMPDLSNKDASAALRGFWGIELAELDRILRAESSTVKEFLSRTFDDYRPPYERSDQRFPRECVFIGTTNEKDFLRDSTGNRRFWPIELLRPINLDYVREHRDEVWAEAVALAKAGEPHWYDDETALEEAREAFIQYDPWHDTIADYLAGRDWIRSAEAVYYECLARGDQHATVKLDKRIRDRIGATLRRLGCEPARRYEDGQRVRGWLVPEHLQAATPSDVEKERRAADAVAAKARELAKN